MINVIEQWTREYRWIKLDVNPEPPSSRMRQEIPGNALLLCLRLFLTVSAHP